MNCVIFGAGGWGTAMAIHLARQGQTVTLVPRRAEQALALATTRENKDYLPGHRLDDSIQIGLEPLPALMDADLIFLACPSKLERTCGWKTVSGCGQGQTVNPKLVARVRPDDGQLQLIRQISRGTRVV